MQLTLTFQVDRTVTATLTANGEVIQRFHSGDDPASDTSDDTPPRLDRVRVELPGDFHMEGPARLVWMMMSRLGLEPPPQWVDPGDAPTLAPS